MKSGNKIDLNFWAMLVVAAAMICFLAQRVLAKGLPQEKCVIRLNSHGVAKIQISSMGTVLNFPVKPSDVIFGHTGSFGVKYVVSDLALSPLSSSSKTNLFVYLEGRQFTFELSTALNGGCPKIWVRDSRDDQVSVDGFFRPKK